MKNFSSDFDFPWKSDENNGTTNTYMETFNAGICVCILSVSRHVSVGEQNVSNRICRENLHPHVLSDTLCCAFHKEEARYE